MIALFLIFLFSGTPAIAEWETTTYHWEIGEEPSGQETAFVPQPIEVEIENTGINALLSSSASYILSRDYQVYLSPEWDEDKAYLLLLALQDMIGEHEVIKPGVARGRSYLPWKQRTPVIGY